MVFCQLQFQRNCNSLLLSFFYQVIDKYDQYSIANWLNEKLPDITTLERLHYKVITGLGPYLHDNLINSITSDILHYEKV